MRFSSFLPFRPGWKVMRRLKVLRENTAIALLILATLMLDVVAVALILAK